MTSALVSQISHFLSLGSPLLLEASREYILLLQKDLAKSLLGRACTKYRW